MEDRFGRQIETVTLPISKKVIYSVDGITIARPERDDEKALMVFNNMPPVGWVEPES